MQENCLFGSEGGAKLSFVPTPIREKRTSLTRISHAPTRNAHRAPIPRPRDRGLAAKAFAPAGRFPSGLRRGGRRIALSSGQLEFVQGQISGGRFVIDMTSIVCSDLRGTELHDVLINHLQSDDFFDVARFPIALYVINAARRVEGATSGQPNIEIAGDLTLKGISGPLAFRAAAAVTPDGKAAAQAVFSFDRTRWNILYGSGRYFHRLGMHLVNDLVDLEIKIVTH